MREGIEKIIKSKNKTLLAFCFSFIMGATMSSWPDISHVLYFKTFFYAANFIFIFFAIIFWYQKTTRFCLLSSYFFVLGVWRVFALTPDCANPDNICHHNDEDVAFTGQISREPDRRVDKTNYVFAADNVSGSIIVQAKNYPEYHYGDIVRLACKLQTPFNLDASTFRYDKFLAKEGIWSVCAFPQIFLIPNQHPRGSSSMRLILSFKQNIANRIDALWPEPESSFMAGLLYGSKSGLPQEIKDTFSKTGITHIVAVSGYNITIIASVLMMLLVALGLWRQQAYWVVMAAIILFTIFTGLSASAVRAAIMGGLVLTAQYLGRRSEIGTALVVTAALMAFINPFIVLWDAGFQLSFLATLGLVYLSPILQAKWGRLPIHPLIKEPLIATLSAIIVTTPLILYQFGRLSLVAPLVNILVLWIIPWLMLVGFSAVVLSFIFFPLAIPIAYIGTVGLKYVIMVAHLFASPDRSSLQFTLPWWGMVMLYVVMFNWIVTVQAKNKDKL